VHPHSRGRRAPGGSPVFAPRAPAHGPTPRAAGLSGTPAVLVTCRRMLARRIIAVSPDKAFGRQLAVALKAAGGAVDLHQTLDGLGDGELAAPLLVVHLAGELAGMAATLVGRLTGDARAITILPRSNLATVVDVMQCSDRVAGMMVADDFDSRALSAMATRVLAGDIFGLDKVMPWGTQLHSYLVGDYQEKSLCIA